MKTASRLIFFVVVWAFLSPAFGAQGGKVGVFKAVIEALGKAIEKDKSTEKEVAASKPKPHEPQTEEPMRNCFSSVSSSSSPSKYDWTQGAQSTDWLLESCPHSDVVPTSHVAGTIPISDQPTGMKKISSVTYITPPQGKITVDAFAENIGTCLVPMIFAVLGLRMLRKGRRRLGRFHDWPLPVLFFSIWIGGAILATLIGYLGIQLLAAASLILFIWGVVVFIAATFSGSRNLP